MKSDLVMNELEKQARLAENKTAAQQVGSDVLSISIENWPHNSASGRGARMSQHRTWAINGKRASAKKVRDLFSAQARNKNWGPWQLSPDSDPEQRWILVNINDDCEEHQDNILYPTEEAALESAKRKSGEPHA